ncbi:hypothetical protein CCAX7_22680 [Capsulimonas corticalis]|uniref:Uncharacterized protein n=1 Tax=Capsulimonas corticalis TaxID=2219043 RepID=A0A402CUZ1_9BACT|nr:nuclear transport factor 2 family protein [Capsulimonas corticalis]BDI30217.1 hypothetical protein CCAX7_22680 [Capsulimonas corticalis]
MSIDNTEVIRQGYDAHARRDFAAIFATLHPEVEFVQTDLVPWGGSHHGHEGVREFFGKLNARIETQVVPEEYVEAGEQVAVLGHIQGKVRATGHEFTLRIVHIWTVRDGLVTRFEAYIDTPAMLRALAA